MMGKRSPAKKKHWRQVMKQHRSSGLSVRAFCANRKVNESQFYSWKRELQRRDLAKRQVTPAPRDSMVPVEVVVDASRRSACVEIIVDDTFRMAVEPGFDPRTLTDVLQVLEQRRC